MDQGCFKNSGYWRVYRKQFDGNRYHYSYWKIDSRSDCEGIKMKRYYCYYDSNAYLNILCDSAKQARRACAKMYNVPETMVRVMVGSEL